MDRGIGACAKKLPLDNLWKTVMAIRGCLINQSKQPIILTTGFYIKSVGKTETDGPPGTILKCTCCKASFIRHWMRYY